MDEKNISYKALLENCGTKIPLKNLSIDPRLILKLILEKQDVNVWSRVGHGPVVNTVINFWVT